MSDLTLKTKSSTPKQKYVQLTFFCKQHIPIIIENRIDERHLIILINREKKIYPIPTLILQYMIL
jgi:hypothetical protein